MKYMITAEQKHELEQARRVNKNKRVENRLRTLVLRAEGTDLNEIAKITGYSRSNVSKLIATYCKEGIGAIVENHYPGNNRNMTVEEETALLKPFREKAEQGQIIEVRQIKAVYEEKVGRATGETQIYNVLRRHGWRKVMPRSKRPNKASEMVIEA